MQRFFAEPAIVTAHPPPFVSPFGLRPNSSFTSLRWMRRADGCERMCSKAESARIVISVFCESGDARQIA